LKILIQFKWLLVSNPKSIRYLLGAFFDIKFLKIANILGGKGQNQAIALISELIHHGAQVSTYLIRLPEGRYQ
jgi:hypothetical protein